MRKRYIEIHYIVLYTIRKKILEKSHDD